MKCNICNRESVSNGTYELNIGDHVFEVISYSPNISTFWGDIAVCDDCMDIYNKINAFKSGITFTWNGNRYFADGRNLKDKPYTEEEFERKVYYTVNPIFEDASKEEFDKFISEYPNKLESDCCGVCEPPLVSYNDFKLATHFPDSIVASFDAGEPNDHYGWDYKRKYIIMKNYKKVLNSIKQ